MRRATIAMTLAALAFNAHGFDADFYLVPGDCRQIIGYHSDGSVKVAQGDPPTYACARQGAKITCVVGYKSGGKPQSGPSETFRVLLDSPPVLYFGSDNGATFFAVNLTRRTVIMTARIVELDFVGNKVCGSTYATASELEALQKRSR